MRILSKQNRCALLLVTLAPLVTMGGCSEMSHRPEPATTQRAPGGAAISKDLRDTLAMMLRASDQKTQLAFYATTPLLKNVDEPFKGFFSRMSNVQGDLEKQLKAWAKLRRVDLSFKFTDDIAGRAQKIMEDRQGATARSDDKAAFERDELFNMYMDYEWQISLITAALPEAASDPELKVYLQNSLSAHESGSREIRGLLQKYHFDK